MLYSMCALSTSRRDRSEEHTSELQSRPHLVCRLLLEKKKQNHTSPPAETAWERFTNHVHNALAQFVQVAHFFSLVIPALNPRLHHIFAASALNSLVPM